MLLCPAIPVVTDVFNRISEEEQKALAKGQQGEGILKRV
jgi:hypothetical protein